MESLEKYNSDYNSKERTEEEIRDGQADKVLTFLKRINIFEHTRQLLETGDQESLSFKQFKDFLIRLNGIIRGIPINKRMADGENVQLVGFVESFNFPRQDDKRELLEYAYKSGLKIDRNDLKYLIPAVINAVHLFEDGNGRTSRLVHLLLENSLTEGQFYDEAKKALGVEGRYDSVNVNPGLISYDLEKIVAKNHNWVYDRENPMGRIGPIWARVATVELGNLDKSKECYARAKNFFDLYNDSPEYVLTAIYEVFNEDTYMSFLSDYGDRKMISPGKMLDSLDLDSWDRLLDKYYQLQKEHVETLVNSFIEPEKYKTESGETIREKFIRRISEQGEISG